MFKKAGLASLLAVAASSAFAADTNSFYAGVDVGQTKFDGISGNKSGFGGFVGYRFNPNFAAELGYRRLASFTLFSADVDVKQTALSAIGTFPLGNDFSLFGRLGYNRLSAGASAGGRSASDSTSKALVGAGVSYAISPTVSTRLEFQRPSSDTKSVNLGLSFSF